MLRKILAKHFGIGPRIIPMMPDSKPRWSVTVVENNRRARKKAKRRMQILTLFLLSFMCCACLATAYGATQYYQTNPPAGIGAPPQQPQVAKPTVAPTPTIKAGWTKLDETSDGGNTIFILIPSPSPEGNDDQH